MSIATDLKAELESLLTGYTFQFGAWLDSGQMNERFAVIQPVSGQRADIVRYPQYRIVLVGLHSDGDAKVYADAEAVVGHLRDNDSFGELDTVLPSEPVPWATNENRPVFEVPLFIMMR